MKLVENYKHWIGLIVIAAICLMIVQNLGHIFAFGLSLVNAVMPLIFGVVMAFILNIIVDRYERYIFPKVMRGWKKNIRRPLAIILSLFSVFFIIGLVMYLAIPQTVHALTLAVQNLPSIYDTYSNWVIRQIEAIPYVDAQVVNDKLESAKFFDGISEYALSWGSNLINTASNVVSFFVNLLVGFFFSLYILLNKDELKKESIEFFVAYFSEKNRQKLRHVLEIVYDSFSSFFVGQFLDALTLGLMVFVVMFISGIPYAASIACVVGLTALVPLVGAWVGASIGLIMLVMDNPVDALAFLVILLVCQQIENNLIYPKLVGNSIGLPGIWVFASIIVGANLLGVVGILLAVPFAASVYKLVREDIDKNIARKVPTSEIIGTDGRIVASGLLQLEAWIAIGKKLASLFSSAGEKPKNTAEVIVKTKHDKK